MCQAIYQYIGFVNSVHFVDNFYIYLLEYEFIPTGHNRECLFSDNTFILQVICFYKCFILTSMDGAKWTLIQAAHLVQLV